MSWKDAKTVAAMWIKELGLPVNLQGREIDLRALGATLPFRGSFHQMILRAATRELRHRGARVK